MILKAEFEDLVEKAKNLQLGRKSHKARHPDFKLKVIVFAGDDKRKKLAGMMKGFEKAGGKKEHVVHVKKAFEEMLQKAQNVKMHVDALADVCAQYSQLG